LICPNEKIEMQQVKAESHYGQTVILDQCPGCGGIWFDSFELYMAKQGQAGKIELLNVDCLQASSLIENSELHCPRDRTTLIRFSDPFLPKDLILARCPACNGFWLNRGEFLKYQQYRQTRQASNKPKEITIEDNKFERDIVRVFEENKTKDSTELLGKLGSFLSMPLNSVNWQPQEREKLSDKEKNALDLIMTALTLILRLFIRI
jgi:Zn-finger nucleic acid-binding protein